MVKNTDQLLREIRRAKAEARGGYVGMNLMAAINKAEFETYTRIAIEEKLSFIVQGAGISREIIKWCRAGGIPFAGIVSSGRLAAMYEKWGADFLVAEGSEAGGHIGDVDEPLPQLVREVLAHTTLPVVAAGGVVADDIPGYLEAGAAGVQLASRFLACSDGDAHPNFKAMHLGKTADDIVLIKSCVKGMSARAVRNEFTEALAAGKAFPPVSKAWHYGPDGYHGRTQPCVECLAENICLCRESDFQESFCITDALVAAAVHGDVEERALLHGQLHHPHPRARRERPPLGRGAHGLLRGGAGHRAPAAPRGRGIAARPGRAPPGRFRAASDPGAARTRLHWESRTVGRLGLTLSPTRL